MEKIDLQDILQILIGSLAGAFGFAFTEELHLISENISWSKLALFFIMTLLFVGLLAYGIGIRKVSRHNIRTLAFIPTRILLIYGASIVSCIIALWLYDLISLQTPIVLIVRKIVVLALPATAGGTLVDLIGTKNR